VGTQHDSKPALDLSVGELVGCESLTLLTHASQHGLRRSKVQDRTRPDRQEVVSSSSDRNYAHEFSERRLAARRWRNCKTLFWEKQGKPPENLQPAEAA